MGILANISVSGGGGVKRTGSPTGKALITGSGMPWFIVGTGGTNSSRGSLILLINSCSGLGGIAGGKISLGKSISTTFLGGTCIGGCTGGSIGKRTGGCIGGCIGGCTGGCNGNTGGNIGNGIGRLGAGGIIGKGTRRLGVGVDMIVSIGSRSIIGILRIINLSLSMLIMVPWLCLQTYPSFYT
jgi:hypothetical protein